MPSHSSAFARAALGLMLVLAVAPVASAAPSRHESVPRGTIAVASSQDFRTMFLMNASDGRVTRIRAPDRVPTQRIDLSPSGNTIALAGLTGIWLVERSGRDAKQVLDFESATFAPDWVSWSPDGRSLAFTRAETLYVVRIADKRVRRILRGGVYAPDWSPDGSRLVFVRNADRRTGGGSVQSVDLNGRNLETIASGGHPDVSPDGSKVVFATREGIRVILPEIYKPTLRDFRREIVPGGPSRRASGVVSGRTASRIYPRDGVRACRLRRPSLRDAGGWRASARDGAVDLRDRPPRVEPLAS